MRGGDRRANYQLDDVAAQAPALQDACLQLVTQLGVESRIFLFLAVMRSAHTKRFDDLRIDAVTGSDRGHDVPVEVRMRIADKRNVMIALVVGSERTEVGHLAMLDALGLDQLPVHIAVRLVLHVVYFHAPVLEEVRDVRLGAGGNENGFRR